MNSCVRACVRVNGFRDILVLASWGPSRLDSESVCFSSTEEFVHPFSFLRVLSSCTVAKVISEFVCV